MIYTNFRERSIPARHKDRSPIFSVLLVLVGCIFLSRLFYIQIIKHETYKASAIAEQLKKFAIPAERGTISLLSGDSPLPIVLNESRYLIFADPALIKKPTETAQKLAPLIGVEVDELKKKLQGSGRYVELAKKLDENTKTKIINLKLSGIGSVKQKFRTYPEGQLASQLLGFVNYDGEGQYGVEGYLNEELNGTDGLLKAITDVRGVPLAGNSENVVRQPVDGADITLSVDITMQRIAEEAIRRGVEGSKASAGSVIIMEANTGAVKAMANWPTYDPSAYDKVSSQSLYKNRNVTDAMEIGSIMKLMTISAGIDLGAISKDTTYKDKGYEEADGYRVKNALSYGERTFSIFDIIKYSLNTGAVHVLKAMGGGELDEETRKIWHQYLTDHYRFGSYTGIEQIGESKGIVPDPSDGYGLNIQYANTAFGQGISVTMAQFAAALCALVNGGTYYQPSVVYSTKTADGHETFKQPKVVSDKVVTKATSMDIVSLMEQYASENNRETARDGFSIGGKTGTAEIPKATGGYKKNIYNGTYAGFVGGEKPEYVIVLRVDEPQITGSAGAVVARPIFTEIANTMMDTLPFSRGL